MVYTFSHIALAANEPKTYAEVKKTINDVRREVMKLAHALRKLLKVDMSKALKKAWAQIKPAKTVAKIEEMPTKRYRNNLFG